MFQGQICRIETRNPELKKPISGWFQRLRDEETSRTSYFAVGKDNETVIDMNDVDDSMLNKFQSRPYVVTLVVPTRVQVKQTVVDDSIMFESVLTSVNDKIRTYREKSANLKIIYDQFAEDLRSTSDEMIDCEIKIAELEQIVNESIESKKTPTFTYVYGKHTANGAEFCWRVPSELKAKIRPGVTALCATRYGEEPVIVTRVEELGQYLDHKMVVGVSM